MLKSNDFDIVSPVKTIDLSFADTLYPRKDGPFSLRKVARGLILKDGRLFIHLLSRDDIFGKASYPETPGGGVQAEESYEEALAREMEEEIGYRIEGTTYLGKVVDEYALIGRTNENHFFLARAVGEKGRTVVASKGDSLIEKTVLLSVEEAIELYEKNPSSPIFELIKRRELPFLRLLKENPGLLL